MRGTHGQMVSTKNGKMHQRATEGVQKRALHLVQNNDGQLQRNDGTNKFQELKVVNPYDNDNRRFNSNRSHDSFANDSAGYTGRQDSRSPNNFPSQVQKLTS